MEKVSKKFNFCGDSKYFGTKKLSQSIAVFLLKNIINKKS